MSYAVNAHFEILVDGKWHYYGEGQFNNHVDFIDVYADWVTENGQRYTPDDATKTTQLHAEKNGDPQSYSSWLTSGEYTALMSKLTPELTSGAFTHGDMMILYANPDKWPKDKPEGVQDFRVIMWLEY